jgi:hypothetical protein
VSGEALGLGVLLGVAELEGVALRVGEMDGVALGVIVALGVTLGEQDASSVAPPWHKEGQPQIEQDGAPPVEKVPEGQGMAFTVERGQKEPAGQRTGAPEEQK